MSSRYVNDDNSFQFTVKLEAGMIHYDCGYATRITDMWDQDGDYTVEWQDAKSIAWRPPGDYPPSHLLVMELEGHDEDDVMKILEH